jgi:tetratricopeptide (TPR) repeat protein
VADALADLSRFGEAEAAFRAALARIASHGAEQSPQAIYLETMLAELLDRAGRAGEASVLFRSALDKGRRQLGPRHPQVAQILIKFGFLLNMRGEYQEGEAALDEAIGILEPLGHYDAAAAHGYKGTGLLQREKFVEAREEYARAERMHRSKLGDDNPMTWWSSVYVAYSDARLGKVEEALPRLQAAVAALERLHGADSNDARGPRKYLGEVLRMAGRCEEAEGLHLRSLELERRLFGSEDTVASASTKHQIALDILESGRPERLAEASRFAAESLAFFRTGSPTAARLGEVLATEGRIAAAQGDRARARKALEEAVALLSAARGDDAPSTRTARKALAALAGPRRPVTEEG